MTGLIALLGLLVLPVALLVYASLRPQRAMAVWMAAGVLVVTSAMYWLTGAPQVAVMDGQRRAEIAAAQPQIDRLEQHLAQEPQDVRALAELGRIYMETGRYRASASAWRQAVLASGGDAGLILQYNKALILAADGEVTDAAKNGLEMVLKLEPGNPEARYFLALRELQQGEPTVAMAQMKALYHELPEDSLLKEIIDRQIGRR